MTSIEQLLEEHKDLSASEESFARDYLAYLRMRKLMRGLAAPIETRGHAVMLDNKSDDQMLNTGIFIRAKISDSWQSVDIGDPRLTPRQLLTWMANTMDYQSFCSCMLTVKEVVENGNP